MNPGKRSFFGCLILQSLLVLWASAPAHAEMAVEWFGGQDRCRHKTMTVELSKYGKEGLENPKMSGKDICGIHALAFDLAALKPKTKIFHASLRIQAPLEKIRTDKRVYMNIGQGVFYFDPLRLYAEMEVWKPVEIYAAAEGSAAGHAVFDKNSPLKLELPRYRSFDCTAAVQAWVDGSKPNLGFVVRQLDLWDWQPERTVLEVRYDGKPEKPPAQAKDLKVFHRKGQTFITWTEVEKIIENESIAWAEFEPVFKQHSPRGRVFYRIYRHNQPLSAATLHQAELVNEIWPLSGYDTRTHQHVTAGEEWTGLDPKCIVHRYSVSDAPAGALKPNGVFGAGNAAQWWSPELPLHTGLYVHQAPQAGKFHYAVTALVDGVENTVDFSPANALAEPVEESTGPGEPMLYRVLDQSAGTGKNREARETQFFMYWAAPPYANLPRHPIHIMLTLRKGAPLKDMSVVYEGDGMYGSSLVSGPNLHFWKTGDLMFTLVSDSALATSSTKSHFNTLIATTESKPIPYSKQMVELFTPWAKAVAPRLGGEVGPPK